MSEVTVRHLDRVGQITVEIQLPDGVPAARRKALLAVASHCAVHNTLIQPPVVNVALAGAEGFPETAA